MKNTIKRTLAIALGAVSTLIAAPTTASADTRIAWSQSNGDGTRSQIVSAAPDGSQLQRLTHPAKDVFDIDPAFSPDGTRIAFAREHPRTEVYEAGIVDAGGTNEQILNLGCVAPCAADAMPSWLPGGERIAYTPVFGPFEGPMDSAASAVLHSANTDGSGVTRLSEPGIDGVYEDYHARYSADGSYLVFVRIRNVDLDVAIFRMDADGSDVRRLTPWGLRADIADLSLATAGPTRDLVVFETYGTGAPEGEVQNIATVPTTCTAVADCRSKIRYLTTGDGSFESFNPTWAPNGRRIAYVRFRDGTRERPPVGDIWTIRHDGTNRRPVSTSPRFEYRPDWGPVAEGGAALRRELHEQR